MVALTNQVLLTNLSVAMILRELHANEQYLEVLKSRLDLIDEDIQQIIELGEAHLNKFLDRSSEGELAAKQLFAEEATTFFLNWYMAPLRDVGSSFDFEFNVNTEIQKLWGEIFGRLNEADRRTQIVSVSSWNIGTPLWSEGDPLPALFQVSVFDKDVSLAYLGLVEHLRNNEKILNSDLEDAPEVLRTAIVWRLSALFEALAGSANGPRDAIRTIKSHSLKVLQDSFRNEIDLSWPEELISLRDAFSHVIGSLKSKYDTPTNKWIIKQLKKSHWLIASSLSHYFAREVPENTAKNWLTRALSEAQY